MTKEQQMQIRMLCEQQGMMHALKQTSAEAMIAALEARLRINSQPKEGDVKKGGSTLSYCMLMML